MLTNCKKTNYVVIELDAKDIKKLNAGKDIFCQSRHENDESCLVHIYNSDVCEEDEENDA